MSNVSTKKIYIQIESAEEQQEHIRNQRKTLKVIQGVATDKENLAGRHPTDRLSRLKAAADITLASVEHSKRKKVEKKTTETQTSPVKQEDVKNSITAEDLTSTNKPSEKYFEHLAEKRREALEATLAENQSLHERIEGLEEELNTTRKLLEESKSLVEVLTEMLNENEAGEELDEEGQTKINDNDDDSDTRSSIDATADGNNHPSK